MKMSELKEGMIVRFKSHTVEMEDPKDNYDIPEQRAEIIHIYDSNDCLLYCIIEEDRDGEDFDGFGECDADMVKEIIVS